MNTLPDCLMGYRRLGLVFQVLTRQWRCPNALLVTSRQAARPEPTSADLSFGGRKRYPIQDWQLGVLNTWKSPRPSLQPNGHEDSQTRLDPTGTAPDAQSELSTATATLWGEGQLHSRVLGSICPLQRLRGMARLTGYANQSCSAHAPLDKTILTDGDGKCSYDLSVKLGKVSQKAATVAATRLPE